MKSFLEFLIEMSIEDAMKLFGIKEIPSSKEELNKYFKKLALKNHPDLGGSEETMKLINQAKEILDKNIDYNHRDYKPVKPREKDPDYQKKYDYTLDLIEHTLLKFNGEVYKKYLESIFGTTFNVKIEYDSPRLRIKNVKNWLKNYITLEMELSDLERDKVFILTFTADVLHIYNQIFNKKGLSSEDKTFDMMHSCFVYVDGKKQVITKEKYISTSDAKIFDDPTILLPKTKMIKLAKGDVRKNSKLSKRDFEAMFKSKFNGYKNDVGGSQTYYYIPINDYVVVLWRSVFSYQRTRIAWYSLYAIGKKSTSIFKKYDTYLEYPDIIKKYPGFSSKTQVYENQDGFDFLLKSLTKLKRNNNIDEFIKSYIEFGKNIQ